MFWRERMTEDGSLTLVDPAGRACHSLAGAWSQARERYAKGAGLERTGRAVVRLLDVGTGLGLNLAAALEAVEGCGGRLCATSLELCREPLEFALFRPEPAALPWHLPVTRSFELALGDPVRARFCGVPLGRRSRLFLSLGDARQSVLDLDTRFDAIFLDPFAPREAPELWQAPFLRDLGRLLDRDGILVTYCAATLVRMRLIAAGLAVGRLPRVGHKAEGTAAGWDPSALAPLPQRLLRRLARRAKDLQPEESPVRPGGWL